MTLIATVFALSAAARDDDEGTEQDAEASLFPIQPAWTTDLGHAPSAAPAFDDERAYVPLRNGTLAAVRLRDGEVAWSVEQATTFPPLPGDGTVIVADETSLVSRRASDGEALWVLDLTSAPSAAPLRKAGWLVLTLSERELVALRAADGYEIWRRSFESALHTRPSLGGDRLLVPLDDGRLLALDLLTGEQVWERDLGGLPGEVLSLDSLFVGSTNNYLYRLSRDKGTVDWYWRTGGDIVGAPVADEDWVFFASLDNLLYALDQDSGVQQWRRPLRARARAGPVLIGDVLFLAGVSDELPTYDRKTGRRANTLSAPGELGAPPHISPALETLGLRLVLLVADGRLIGMKAASGPPVLSLDFPPPPLLPAPELLDPADVLPFEPLIGSVAPAPSTEPATPDLLDPVEVLPFEPLTGAVPPAPDAEPATPLEERTPGA